MPRQGSVSVFINKACICTGRAFIHPGSVNFDVGRFDSGWLVYTELVATAKLYVRESSMVPVYALLLFGGKQPKYTMHAFHLSYMSVNMSGLSSALGSMPLTPNNDFRDFPASFQHALSTI